VEINSILNNKHIVLFGATFLLQGILTEGDGLSKDDLLELTSLDKMLLIMQKIFDFSQKSYLIEEVDHNEPSPSVRIPCLLSQ
jgi:hypothetical protein